MFETTPFTRQRPGECGSVSACRRALSSAWLVHHTCAQPRKKRCSGVKPSIFAAGFPASVESSAM